MENKSQLLINLLINLTNKLLNSLNLLLGHCCWATEKEEMLIKPKKKHSEILLFWDWSELKIPLENKLYKPSQNVIELELKLE